MYANLKLISPPLSATNVSSADEGNTYSARNLPARVSQWMEASLNILTCSFSHHLPVPLLLLNSNASHKSKLYKLKSLPSLYATLVEPAACAVHGLDRLKLNYGAGPGPTSGVGVEVLLLGAGPTGLIMAQLLRLNGASKVVVAARKGVKMDVAKKLDIADEYIEVDRENPEAEWNRLKERNPFGFDVVVSCCRANMTYEMLTSPTGRSNGGGKGRPRLNRLREERWYTRHVRCV